MRRTIQTFFDVLAQSAGTCAANPLRTVLSVLAITAAVATIALVVTGLEGFQGYARDTSERAFGSDTFVLAQVVPGQLSRKELALKLQRNPVIRRSDVKFLEKYADGEVIYSPYVQQRGDVVAGGRKFEAAAINGCEATMFRIRDLGISGGRFFREEEARSGALVAVIGAEIDDELFPGTDPLGKKIRIAGRAFRVVGLQDRQGSAGGVSLDRYVWIPLRAYERLFGAPATLQVFAKSPAPGGTQVAEDRARSTLRARRQLRPGSDANFDILTPEAARSFVLQISERIGAAAGPISLAALLAAVVVVTNTSLVSVTQRTREIGIRRAVGASRIRIVAEVLAESTMLSLFGGISGTMVAWGLLALGEQFLGFELPLQAATVAWSLVAATASGAVAGFYPARRAARIQVIQALRVE